MMRPMVSHFVDKERAFVNGLEAATGHALDAWMGLIARSGNTSRNDIIDWLRQQGFTFAEASWLERIHHNGGKLIYADGVSRQATAAAAARSPEGVPPQSAPSPAPLEPAERAKPLGRIVRDPSREAAIEAALAAGKAYRPLAQVLLREILGIAPAADLRVEGVTILFAIATPFAALSPGPKGVRLNLPDGAAPAGLFQSTRQPGPGGLTAAANLTDVRQVDDQLLAGIAEAARRSA